MDLADTLMIPDINIDIEKSYKELVDKDVLINKIKRGSIAEARQKVQFSLDYQGAKLKSSAELLYASGVQEKYVSKKNDIW